MSDYDDENPPGGSVWPWILLTFVAVGAGVGMFFFNMQKEQALVAVGHIKTEYDQLKKHQQSLDEQRHDLEKQLADMKSDRDALEVAKAEAAKKVDELTAQLALTKAEAADAGKKGKPGKKGHRR